MTAIIRKSRLKNYLIALMLGFTVLTIISLSWNIVNVQQQVRQLAELEAKTNLNKDLAFRLWATRHGGAYFIVNARTQPSPFLANVKDRDVNISSTKMLTLYNPATMLRDIMHDYSKLYGVKTRITGKIYMNPENAPDAWESKALEALLHGKKSLKSSPIWMAKNICVSCSRCIWNRGA